MKSTISLRLPQVAALLVLLSGCGGAAEPPTGAAVAKECAAAVALAGDAHALSEGNVLPSQLGLSAGKCDLATTATGKAVEFFFAFHELRERRDLPNSMARQTGAGNDQQKRDIEALDKLIVSAGSIDASALDAVVRHMVEQREDVAYAWSALEIAARARSATYESYSMPKDGDKETRRAWEQVRERWLSK